MIRVKQILNRGKHATALENSVQHAAKLMQDHGVSSLLVKDGEATLGILTETDIVQKVVAPGQDPSAIRVSQIMSAPLITIEASQSVVEADELMNRHRIRHLVVVENARIIGMISLRDVLIPLQYLEELSTHDGLTHLYNHRAFGNLLREELERSQRHGHAFCLLMIDLDRFKAVNDSYGHPAGDKALRSVANLISKEAREVDKVARYGGEEFALILPETGREGGLQIAERIRKSADHHTFWIGKAKKIRLTVSIGVSEYPRDAQSEDKLIAAADGALYAAKQGGRNRVCAA